MRIRLTCVSTVVSLRKSSSREGRGHGSEEAANEYGIRCPSTKEIALPPNEQGGGRAEGESPAGQQSEGQLRLEGYGHRKPANPERPDHRARPRSRERR